MAFATIRRGASKDGYIAVPVEGSSFFIPSSQAALLALHEDQELSEQEFHDLRLKVLGQRCQQKAMTYLARREHSRRELELKLKMKEFPQDIIEEQLDVLQKRNLLSDQRFAEQFIISRQRKHPEGPSVLIIRLLQRGVDREIADAAVRQWFADDGSADDALARAARRLARSCGNDERRLSDQLRRKGFDSSQIRRLFDAES